MLILMLGAGTAWAGGYEDYSVSDAKGIGCSDCVVTSAGDVDGDAQGDLLVRESGGNVSVLLATTVGGSKQLTLSQADFVLNAETFGDLSGLTVTTVGDVDQDGKDDLFVAEAGETYQDGEDDDDLIPGSTLSQYQNTQKSTVTNSATISAGDSDTSAQATTVTSDTATADDSEVNVTTTRATPKDGVTVGVGVSEEIGCALTPGVRGEAPHATIFMLSAAALLIAVTWRQSTEQRAVPAGVRRDPTSRSNDPAAAA